MLTRRAFTLSTLALATALTQLNPGAAGAAPTTTAYDPARGCIENGFFYQPPSGSIAEAAHCFATADASTLSRLAAIDTSLTEADLAEVQYWSPLHPEHYLARSTMATRAVANAPRASNSAAMAAFVNALPKKYVGPDLQWLRTGANIGGGCAANDNIPVYTVDSSNPHQTLQKFSSSDARVTNFPRLMALCSGTIPLPTWAKPSDGGDHSLAIFDVATGIWRSYYHVVKDSSGVWQYAAAGYLYADPSSLQVGSRNFWLSLVQGSSSVVGLANELTQIGFEEVRRGVISHMVSVTIPDFAASKISFPAKQTDGRSSDANAPWAGQMFTFPASFDVDAYVSQKGIDPVTASIMRAVKKFGGMVTDHNNFCMAFNFENPYGMGVRADDPNANPWLTDPTVAPRIQSMSINTFPWELTEWIAPHWAGTTQATPSTLSARAAASNDLVAVVGDTLVDARTSAVLGRGYDGTQQLLRIDGLTGAGRIDLLSMSANGDLWLSPGSSTGWKRTTQLGCGWSGYAHLMYTPTGGAKGSLVAVEKSTGVLWRYPFTSSTTLGSRGQIGRGWGALVLSTIVADADNNGLPDLIGTFSDGRLIRYGFNAAGSIASTTQIGRGWSGWTAMQQAGQLGGDARRDLLAVRGGDRSVFQGVWSATQSLTMTKIGTLAPSVPTTAVFG